MWTSRARNAERVGLRLGSTTPSNDKLAFLKNLTRHMIGMNSPAADTAILDNLLTDAIVSTYKRCQPGRTGRSRHSTICARNWRQWRDESEVERIRDEAKLAAVKLREWTGERGCTPGCSTGPRHPHGRELAFLQCGGADVRSEAGKLDEHDHR